MPTATPEDVLRTAVALLDEQRWDELPSVLAPTFGATYAHTGERFDRDGYVALNRNYPGRWTLRAQWGVGDETRAAVRAMVFNDDRSEVHHVALFATVENGLITELTEVWAEVVRPDTERRRTGAPDSA